VKYVNSDGTPADLQVTIPPGVDPPDGQLASDVPSAADISNALANISVTVCTNCTTPTCSQFAVIGSSTSLNVANLEQGIINAFSQANSLTSSDITVKNSSAIQLTSV